ncbi:hypothetical protein DPMN_183652 [Dreissena polymorpha]|uniref:Uncharacterized protein n=1 Tax=Dreissena polymorpha TaxID=45954 RepID=A0A9D4DHZ4_DREPO|nr:hypothetical protein DPMN_183652 [Dreissena polymorpha]
MIIIPKFPCTRTFRIGQKQFADFWRVFHAANIGTGLLDAGDQFGRTPLMFCVLADRLECAELLLKAGAQTNMKDKGGRTALHWAAHKV